MGVICTRRLSIAKVPWPIRSKAATGLWVTAALASLRSVCASLTFSIELLSHLCTCPVLPDQLCTSVSIANGIVDKAKGEIETKKKEIDDIIMKAREASAGAGAAVFTQDFDKEASKLSKNANKWLIATAVLGSITLVIAALTWFWTQTGLDTGQIWQKVASKFIVLSILLTATLWCGKIYKALMHQSAINRHRALSLQTFQAFSSAASDVQTKDAVLLETTHSIFSQGVTGYVDSASAVADSDARVIEIVKSIAQRH